MEGFPALAFKGAQASLAAAQYGPVWRKFFQAAVPHTGAFFRLQDVHHMEVSAAQGMGAGVLRFHDRNAGKAKKSRTACCCSGSFRVGQGSCQIKPDSSALSFGDGIPGPQTSSRVMILARTDQMGITWIPQIPQSWRVQLGQAV